VNILVTGGCGYIGATVVNLLLTQSCQVEVVDDLSFGKAEKISSVPLHQFNLSDFDAVQRLKDIFVDSKIDAVIHFAARKQVGESVERPEFYYQQNVGGMANLLLAMREATVKYLVFSSSAAVYGIPQLSNAHSLIDEACPTLPINPYGETKLINETQCFDAQKAWGLEFVALRYFNAAGAMTANLGDTVTLNLIPMVFERLTKGLNPVIFGNDYRTPDGTCVRDYVHVADLAEAHRLALSLFKPLSSQGRLQSPAGVSISEPVAEKFNVGTGVGSSVQQVLQEIRQATGQDFTEEIAPRRAGDPDALVADVSKINRVFNFQPQFGLPEIVQSAWEAWQFRESVNTNH
jgi:UDP-glucose 4-epimerase